MTEAQDVAQWLIGEIEDNGRKRSYQSVLVRRLREKFGDDWVYKNHNGNMAIDRRVLKAFQPLKSPNVIWERSDQSWRVASDEDLVRIKEREERRAEQARLRAERIAARQAGN
ncbi:MAG: DUF6953 family protein [Microbacterium sp.]